MLDLPRDDGGPIPIARDHPRNEGAGRIEQLWVGGRRQQRALNKGVTLLMGGDKELRIAKVLDRAHTYDDLFPRLLSCGDLPVKFIRREGAWGWLALLPVGSKPQHLKWVGQQGRQSRLRIQPQRGDLARAPADAQQRGAAGGDRPRAPAVGRGRDGARHAQLGGNWQGGYPGSRQY